MKTAMQEFVDELNQLSDKEELSKCFGLITILKAISQKLLEKEKEQIIDAFEVGYKSCDLDEAFEINRKLASGELHYNKTYNQNK